MGMTHDVPSETCWQCGALADPACVYTQNLVNRAEFADGLGYPVKRSIRGSNIVKVSIPRCEACMLRNWVAAFLILGGVFVGACYGGLQFPSRGITTILGGIAGSVPGVLLILYYRRIAGFNSVADYPPMKQLRAIGWEEPA